MTLCAAALPAFFAKGVVCHVSVLEKKEFSEAEEHGLSSISASEDGSHEDISSLPFSP